MGRKKPSINKRKEGQRRHDCLIVKCQEKGRIIGRMGKDLPLTYCPKHRKKGERILNFLINSLMRYKLTNFLQDSKQHIFMQNKPKMCDTCQHNFFDFVNEKIQELEEMEQTISLDEVDPKASKDFDGE